MEKFISLKTIHSSCLVKKVDESESWKKRKYKKCERETLLLEISSICDNFN
jgi:hypothetical protein